MANNIYDYFKGNELIECLPPMRDKKAYINAFENSAYVTEEMRDLSPVERSLLVAGLGDFRISRDLGYMVDYQIATALRKGYMLSEKYTDDAGNLYNETPYKKKEDDTSAFILFGPSGVGKTTLLNESLRYYDQVIEHHGPDYIFKQIVYIKVECPPAGSIKTFYDSCLNEFEKALDYIIPDRNRYRTADQKEQLFKHLADRWNLGVLVIDEIQNLLASKNNILMNQFLKLTNELCVPIIYVGTDKIVEYMHKAEAFTIRRFGIQISVEPYKQDVLWDRMINEMWKNQWMKEYVPLTQELNDVFYNESQGIISRVVELYAIAQREAILNGKDTTERFTPEFIEYISNRFFKVKGNLTKPQAVFDSEQGQMLREEMESTKHVILDAERINQKNQKDSLKKRIMTNVLKGTEMMPFSFSQTEIKNTIKEIFKQKNILEKDEKEISKQVISVLLEKNGFTGNKKTEHKKQGEYQSISADDIPRFTGVI